MYLPNPAAVRLALNPEGLAAHGWDLEARTPVHAGLGADEAGLVISRLDATGDAVLFLERR